MGDRRVNIADDLGTRPLESQNRVTVGWQDSAADLEWESENEIRSLSDKGKARRKQMEFPLIGSASLEAAMCRLRAVRSRFSAIPEAPSNWRVNPTIARDRGDYMLHTILGR